MHSELFSLGANFPEFHEWLTINLGKFILGCCMKFDCGLWVAVAEFGVAIMSRFK